MIALLAFVGRYKLVLEIIVIGALALAGVYAVHQFLEHERDIGRAEVQGRWDVQIARDKETAKIETERLAKQAAEAEKNGASREQTIRTLAAATTAAAGSLRDTAATVRSGLSNASSDALREAVSAFGDVFAGCEERRRSLAEEAERINSEKQTLIDAWPQPVNP